MSGWRTEPGENYTEQTRRVGVGGLGSALLDERVWGVWNMTSQTHESFGFIWLHAQSKLHLGKKEDGHRKLLTGADAASQHQQPSRGTAPSACACGGQF